MWNSKPKKRSHKWRKRKHGNPKIGVGVCHGLEKMREAVRQRIDGKHALMEEMNDE